MKKIIINEDKLGDLSYWETLFKTKEDDFKKLKKQNKRELLSDAYRKAPDCIRLDKEWVMKAVKDFYINFYVVDENIKDKQYCIRYVEEYECPSLYCIPEQYQEELFEKVLLKNDFNIRGLWYNKNLYHLNTRENICKWVALKPSIYTELEKTNLQNDFTIAEIAFKNDPQLLFKMNKAIARRIVSKNLELALKLFETNKEIFPILPLKIRNDRDFIFKNIDKLNYENTKYIGKEALAHKEVLLGMKTFYHVTIPEQFLTDREVAYHVISKEAYISGKFKDCENFTLIELIKQFLLENKDIHFYNNLRNIYKEHPEVISVFLGIGYFPEPRKVRSFNPYTNFEHEETQYVDTSVVRLLPENIQVSLVEEFKKARAENREPEENELLSFARSKYLQINLIEKLDEKIKVRKMKI